MFSESVRVYSLVAGLYEYDFPTLIPLLVHINWVAGTVCGIALLPRSFLVIMESAMPVIGAYALDNYNQGDEVPTFTES